MDDTEELEDNNEVQDQAFLTINKWIPIKTTHQSFVVIDNPTYPYKARAQDGLSLHSTH